MTLALSPERALVLVIDVQERLAAAMPEGGARAIRNATVLVEGARALGVPVVATEQYPRGLGPTVSTLRERLADPPLEKLEFDATRNEAARARLEQLRVEGRTQVVLAGMEAHICVYQTARGLVSLGFTVHVVADATASRSAGNAALAEGLFRAAGAHVSGTETVLFDLLGKAEGDAFKTISKLVR